MLFFSCLKIIYVNCGLKTDSTIYHFAQRSCLFQWILQYETMPGLVQIPLLLSCLLLGLLEMLHIHHLLQAHNLRVSSGESTCIV